MEKLHALFGNWGWAIIVLTLLIKLAFFKLSETSYKSMANMRRMTPRMQALKERFGDEHIIPLYGELMPKPDCRGLGKTPKRRCN